MSCEDIPSLLDLQKVKKHADDFGRLMGTGEGTSTNEVTGQVRPTYNKVMKSIGFKRGSGDFTTGFTVMPGERDIAWYDPVSKNWYSYLGVIPTGGYPVSPGTNPVVSVVWSPKTDETLRSDLSSPQGATLVNTSTGDTVEYALAKGVAGTQSAIAAHNADAAAHPQLSAFISAEANRAEAAAESVKPYVDGALSDLSTAANKFYPTLALANADIANITVNQPVTVGEAVNGGLWYKATSRATALTKSAYDPLIQAKSYTNSSVNPIKKLIGEDNSEPLEMAVDESGLLYRYIDHKGNVFYSGGKLEMQDWSTYTDDLPHVRVVLDRDGNIVAILDKDGNFRVAGDIVFGGGSLTEVLSNASNLISHEKINLRIAGQTYQNALINRFPERSEFTSVMTLEESNGLRNRMITGVKVPTGLFMVWHRQTASQYDGDGNGSSFWSAFVDIDENLQVTVRNKKLFIYPDTDAGIVKHPHLGWTNDNRLIMVYEKSIGYSEATPENPVDYIKYIKYSSDNGVTWTAPTQLVFNNSAPTTALMALGTTCEILKLKTGRLIVAMYSTTGLCFCIYSDNDGASWSYSESWISIANWGHEPSIALDSDSNLVMAIRPSGSIYAAAFAKSVDDGENWELMHTDRLTSSINQSFLLYDDSIQAHLISHTTSDGWRRTNFRISISYDDCYTFPLTYAPFPDSKYVGYTQLIKWVDGVYLLLMEYNDTYVSVNSNEQVGIQLINAKEVFNNVNRT